MEQIVIGIDSSTQSTKAIAFDLSGHVLAAGKAALAVRAPHPGWAEQDPADWWRSTVEAMRQLVAQLAEQGRRADQVMAVGLAWQRETFVALDERDQPLRPAILWLDQRATRQAAEARRTLGAERFLQIAGKQLDTTPSFSKLAWMREQEPERYARLARISDVGGYLAHRLTGHWRTCLVGGDSLGLMDMATGRWSGALLAYLDLQPTVLPPVVAPGAPLGQLSPQAAAATGLPIGTPVIGAGGDGQVFAVGVNAPSSATLSLTVGTSLVLGVHWPCYRTGPAYRTMAGCYPNTYLLEGVLRAGADIVRWFVRDFEPSVSEIEMEARLADVPPGCQGLLTVPYWKGRMVPSNEPLARGVTVGWSDYHTLAHFYRSILEGMAYEVRLLIEAYRQDLAIQPTSLHLGGGGALSATWRQIMADVTGLPVVLSQRESTALGAAMIAATSVGAYPNLAAASKRMVQPSTVVAPDKERAGLYTALFQDFYRDLYPLLRPLLVALGKHVLEGKE